MERGGTCRPAFLTLTAQKVSKYVLYVLKRGDIGMEYNALTIGLSDKLLDELKELIFQHQQNLFFTQSFTVQEASQMLNRQIFHLLIADLDYLRSIHQPNWLTRIRRNSFLPVIILSDTPEKDVNGMIRLGADMCISGKWPCSMIADLAYAQLRRYTEYNHYNDPSAAEISSFQVGDILIDPARRIVEVRGQQVNLRPREFSLLLYFMRNPNIVLTSEQICEQAWGMEGGYNQGVSGPIAILRKSIEPDKSKPRYIKTVSGVGYCFTAYRDETCDDCSDSVGVL